MRQLRRVLAAVLVTALAVLGLTLPALAAGGTGSMDMTVPSVLQGVGYTPVTPLSGTFQTGAEVTYRFAVSCSSGTDDCGAAVFKDDLDPGLTPIRVTVPTSTAQLPLTTNITGQTVTVNIGTPAAPWQPGNTFDILVTARINGTKLGTIPNSGSLTTSGVTVNTPVVNITVDAPSNTWVADKRIGDRISTVAPGEVKEFNLYLTLPSTKDPKTGALVALNYLPITGGTLVDTFPAGALVVDNAGNTIPEGGKTPNGGLVSYVTNTVTWDLGGINPRTGQKYNLNPQCDATFCWMYDSPSLKLRFPATAFTTGATLVNTMTANLTFRDGTSTNPGLTDSVSLTVAAVTHNVTVGKVGPAQATPGQTVSWNIEGTNSGNVTEHDFTVIDHLPAGLTNVVLTSGSGPLVQSAGEATYAYSTDNGVNWTTLGTFRQGVDPAFSATLPPEATDVRMIVKDLPPAIWYRMTISATMPTTTGPVKNCVSSPTNDRSACFTTTVVEPFVELQTDKGWQPYVGPPAPGERIYAYVRSMVRNGATSAVDIIDILPAGLEYDGMVCVYSDAYYEHNGPCVTPQPANAAPTVVKNSDGTTTLTWENLPIQPAGINTLRMVAVKFYVKVGPTTQPGSYLNKGWSTSADATPTQCSPVGQLVTDSDDLDHDGSTTDKLCYSTAAQIVRASAVVDVIKWVKGNMGRNALVSTGQPSATCPIQDGYTHYPCVAEVTSGGRFDYLLQHVNSGNVPMTDFVLYDILPHTGDKAVTQSDQTARGTDWNPVMTGPVALDPATVPTGADPVVYYNYSYDPCRPELASGTPGTNWQGAPCANAVGGDNPQNTWVTEDQVTDWAAVKSFKIVMFTGERTLGEAWQPGVRIDAHVPMLAPTSAPESTKDPLDLSVAWNSMGHHESTLASDGSTGSMAAAAPRKVGVIVPFPGVSVGDYVWLDTNRDGLQSPGEAPIPGVTVRLKDATGGVLSTTTTDADGYYSFRYLPPSTQFTLEFVAPNGMSFTKTNASGVTSNDPVADNGSTPLNGTTGGDSDATPSADGTTGTVTFDTGGTLGAKNQVSSPTAGTVADNPGLDAGFVSTMNLKLAKKLETAGPFSRGKSVTYTLTPSNDGPMGALAGWSVTDLAPAGMTITNLTGPDSDYTFDIPNGKATSKVTLLPGTSAAPITVTATINADAVLGSTQKNVAYVSPAPGDVTETVPLVVPDLTTDTTTAVTDNDAEATLTLSNSVSIGDYVWYDTNRNGIQDSTESVVEGMVVNLYAAGAAPGATPLKWTTTTGGYYAFTDLTPSTAYVVEFVKPAGTSFTRQTVTAAVTPGATTANDSNPDVTTGRATVTTPPSGSNLDTPGDADDPTIDAGLVKYNLTIDKELTTEGTINPGQQVTFTLTPHNDGPVDALTGWTVTEMLPTGMTLVGMTGAGYTYAGNVATATAPLRAGQNGPTITVTAQISTTFTTGTLRNIAYVDKAVLDVAETIPVVVPTPGKDTSNPDTDNDAHADVSVTPLVSIGDFVWYDKNRDGIQNNNEPVYAGMTVQLLDASGAVVKTTTTNANGYYVFSDLPPTTAYTVKFVAGAGESFTTQSASGSTTINDSNPDVATGLAPVTTPANGQNRTGDGLADIPTIDAGVVSYDLTLRKVLATTGTINPGQQVTFTLTPHNAGPVDALAGWTVTDLLPSGMSLVSMTGAGYDYSGNVATANDALLAGTDGPVITVVAQLDPSFTLGSLRNIAYVDKAPGDAAEIVPVVVPTPGKDTSNTDTNNDAHADVTVQPLVSIGDFVWYDNNRDGIQNNNEPAYAGMTVQLLDASGAVVKSTTTNASGYYVFSSLPPNTAYTVKFVAGAGESFTTQTVTTTGATTANDSNPDVATGLAPVTTPANGQNRNGDGLADIPTIDAGVVKYNLRLAKALTSKGAVYAGSTVTFELRPHNDGPATALTGWTVTELLPAGLTMVSMSGAGYTYAGNVATATAALAGNADGPVITVTATVNAGFVGGVKNVAYVDKAPADVPETNPLGDTPVTNDTETGTSPTDNDAEAPLTVDSLVSIGDHVWWDTNRDGVQDKGEKPVKDVTVTLFSADGTQVGDPTTTDADGFYSFTDLTPGKDYYVVFTAPAATAFTVANAGSDDTVDSDANVVTGRADFTAPASGSNSATSPDNPTIDAGLVQLNLTLEKTLETEGPFSVGQTVEFTLTPHNDGPVDALAGWTVTDVLPAGLTLVSMTGDGYHYDGNVATATAPLAAGENGPAITVTATIGRYVTGTLRNVAYVAPVTGDAPETTPLVVPTPGKDTSNPDTDNDGHADLLLQPVSIGDHVWWDVNRDGLQTEGESPVEGVTVTLYKADGTTQVGEPTATDADGFYSFTDLAPGEDYVVKFTKPDGTTFTTPLAGEVTADSNPNAAGVAPVHTPTTGENSAITPDDPTIDAGLVQINLVLTKALETEGPFGAGDTVTFTLTPHNDGPVDALAGWSVSDLLPKGLTLVGMTGDDTAYECNDLTATCTSLVPLAAGEDGAPITVTATIDAYTTGVLHNVAWIAPVAGETPETNPLVVPSTVTDTEDTHTDNDAQAVLRLLPVSIGDHVWWDVNRDGLQTKGESPVKDVTVTLYKADGTTRVGEPTTTDADGFYSFTDLAPGQDYIVKFTKPDGTTFTTPLAGDVTADSNPNADGVAPVHTPKTGENSATTPDDPTIDAGLVKINLTLAKTLDTQGPFGSGQTVTFTLTPHNDGPVDALAGWTVSDLLPKGLTLVEMTGDETAYRCDNLTATCTSLVALGAAANGQPITVTATVDPYTTGTLHNVAWIAPVAGETPETNPLVIPKTGTNTAQTDTDNDAQAELTLLPVSIGDHVWWDVNRDGLQSSGEPAVPGVTVTLYQADGTTKVGQPTTTDADGFYSFTDLAPGQAYVVVFTKPDGSTFTTQHVGVDIEADSNADVTTGVAPVITPLTGENSATSPDNPTIDAGLVKFNLTLTKTLEKKGTYKPGDEVSFALVPSNDGPVDALAGWSVTDVLPKGLTLVSMSGAGYTCTDASCMSDSVLPAGQEGAVIWVKAKITATGTGTLINVAYVAPAAGDIAETNPLVVPAQDTDTDASATDNDASAWLGFKTPPPPAPLAFTGASGLGVLLGTALVLLMLGVLLAGLARRKEEDISSLR